jgi:hypothetical protein
VTRDRTLLRLNLPHLVPGCPEDAAAACPDVELASVVLNRVELVFDAVAVGSGFRPLAPTQVVARRLLDPSLGVRAPLGPVVTVETIPPALFAPPVGEPVRIGITGAVAGALERKETELGVSLQIEGQAPAFGYLWIGQTPSLRFIYTLTQPPRLP